MKLFQILLSVFAIVFFITPRPAAAVSLSEFSYKKAITISNSGATLSDYPLAVNIPYVAGMKADFSDLIFTVRDEAVVLDHWIESYSNSGSAVFWVKIKTIPSGNSTIYVYYGNSKATSSSNGARVFPFFDDFSGSTVDSSKWPTTAGLITINSGEVKLDSNSNYSYMASATQNYPGILEFKLKYDYSKSSKITRLGLIPYAKTGKDAGLYGGDYMDRGVHLWHDYKAYNLGINDPGNYHKYKMVKTPSEAQWYFDGTLKEKLSISGNIVSFLFGNPGEPDRKGSAWLDYVFTRPYAQSEPVYSIGQELQNCADDCVSGDRRCADYLNYQVCGNYDRRQCLKWGASASCAKGEMCSNGNCVTDPIAPAVYLSAPASGASLSGAVRIEAYATDNLGVDKVIFYADGNILADGIVFPAVAGAYDYSYEWDTLKAGNGKHELTAKAYDRAGNVKLSSPVTVNINNSTGAAAALCTSYSYSDWSECVNGLQTKKIINKTPSGCTLPESVLETMAESCVIPCAAYNYDVWSKCANGIQTRTISSKTPPDCDPNAASSAYPNIERTCVSSSGCSYVCTAWEACDKQGQQKCAKFLSSPGSGCSNSPPAGLMRKCALDSKIPASGSSSKECTGYEYSDWDPCLPSGKQTRKILAKTPAGCVDSQKLTLERNCDYLPCRGHVYTEWSSCNSAKKQIRSITMSWPSGCQGGVSPDIEKECLPCNYGYSKWGSCQGNGFKTRKLVSIAPADCFPYELPLAKEKCDYRPSEFSSGPIFGGLKEQCVYSYSDWSACVNGKKTRFIISQNYELCKEGAMAEFEQSCNDQLSLFPPIADDAPPPAPESMLSASASTAGVDFNSRTGRDWQRYYFGEESCFDESLCGGEADPDRDGLTNNDEYRFGTNPKSPDTDRDGSVDAEEAQIGNNPLVVAFATTTDVALYEDPKEKGVELVELYKVDRGLVYDSENKKLKITGKALPNSYATLYIYSEQPVILTKKADKNGNLVYIIDKPEDGVHEMYVSVNDKDGKIIAKSAPLPFVQTAEAATIFSDEKNEKTMVPAESRLKEGSFIVLFSGIGGLVLALAAIGGASLRKRDRQ